MPVDGHDDGAQDSMVDLRIGDGDRIRASIEVTAAADSDSIELWKLINGSDDRWIVPALAGGWLVYFTPTARAKRIRAELPDLLADLERHGVDLVETDRPHASSDPLTARAANLGIENAQQGPTAYPGVIYMSIQRPDERVGHLLTAPDSAAANWVGTFLRAPERADVLSKLSRSGAAERHAYIVVPTFSTAPRPVVDLLWRDETGSTPTAPPALPAEVTHVWLAPTWTTGSGLRWSPDNGWSRFPTSVASAQR